MNNKPILLLLILVILPLCSASEGSMKLLAASGLETNLTGSTADLRLEMVPGTGRVFIETFPITKLDTQISTRFAQEVACDFLGADCSRYNFFYTIKSKSSIIGGPSASSAIAVLTAAMLQGQEVNSSIAMTGTINSGGLIGPVGGLRAKLEAAAKENITTVLIPRGERNVTENNKTTDLVEYGKGLGLNVIEVARLSEAMSYFTGKSYEVPAVNITINQMYNDTMGYISQLLCNKNRLLMASVGKLSIPANSTQLREALNLTERAENASSQNKFYSAASYCYGANVRLRYLLLKARNMTIAEIVTMTARMKASIYESNNNLDLLNINTINDLQAAMVVRDRLTESKENLDDVAKAMKQNNTDAAISSLANGIERLSSAASWSNFFNKGGRTFEIDQNSLMESCRSKVSEASERIEYIRMLTGLPLDNTQKQLDYAYDDYDNGRYELCLFKASLAKAEADILISLFGVSTNSTKDIMELKLGLARDNINKQASKGIFPILSYSYYEYAESLKDTDISSALLYVEYALELSNQEIYFKKADEKRLVVDNRVLLAASFAAGLVIGGSATLLLRKRRNASRKGK